MSIQGIHNARFTIIDLDNFEVLEGMPRWNVVSGTDKFMYVSKPYNRTFDATFEQTVITKQMYYSQFAIIMSYAYGFEREWYSFLVQPGKNTLIDKSAIQDNLQHPFSLKPPVRIMLHTKIELFC